MSYSFDIDKLFPFYISINESGEIISFGKSIGKIVEIKVRDKLLEIFEIKKPMGLKEISEFSEYESMIFTLYSSEIDFKLTGELVWKNDVGTLYLTPILNVMDDLKKLNLNINDFAIHDSSLRYVSALESHRRNLEESKEQEKILIEKNKIIQSTSAKFEALYNSSNDGIIIHKPSGEIILTNPKVEKMLGYEKDELIGVILKDLHPTAVLNDFKLALKQLEDSESANFEIPFICKDKGLLPTEVSASVFKIEDEPFVIGLVRDITSRKKYEESILKSNAELNEMVEALDSFVYRVAHDLKSPVINLQSMIKMFKDVTPLEKGGISEEVLGKIDSSCERFSQTINGFLELARLQNISFDELEAVDINPIIKNLLEDLKHLVEGKSATVNINLNVATMYTSKVVLKSTLSNLITNALKYSKEDLSPVINIDSYIEDNNQCISVEDNGVGIDLENYEKKLFAMFQRLNSDNSVSGSGLGLHMTKKMIENIGGTIEVMSAPGHGSNFIVKFPIQK